MLQVSIYALLSKVIEARKSCIEEGNHQPSKEEVARRAGITVEKMERLLFTARMPVSLQQPVWADDRTTYQVYFLVGLFFPYKLKSDGPLFKWNILCVFHP